jgi:hypothetical protein
VINTGLDSVNGQALRHEVNIITYINECRATQKNNLPDCRHFSKYSLVKFIEFLKRELSLGETVPAAKSSWQRAPPFMAGATF